MVACSVSGGGQYTCGWISQNSVAYLQEELRVCSVLGSWLYDPYGLLSSSSHISTDAAFANHDPRPSLTATRDLVGKSVQRPRQLRDESKQ